MTAATPAQASPPARPAAARPEGREPRHRRDAARAGRGRRRRPSRARSRRRARRSRTGRARRWTTRKKALAAFAGALAQRKEELAALPHLRDGQAHRAVAQRADRAAGPARVLPRRTWTTALADEVVHDEARLGGDDLPGAARARRQRLGLELPVLRGLQRVRARAARRQRRPLQAVRVRHPHRASPSPRPCTSAGVPAGVFAPVIGGGEAGRALLEQPLDAVFFTGSYATGRKIAEAAARQLMKVQLELGGKDPVYVGRRRGRRGRGQGHRRRRLLQHRPELLLGGAHLRPRADPRRLRGGLRGGGEGLRGRRSRWTRRPTSAPSPARRSCACWRSRWRTRRPRGRGS